MPDPEHGVHDGELIAIERIEPEAGGGRVGVEVGPVDERGLERELEEVMAVAEQRQRGDQQEAEADAGAGGEPREG